MMSVLDTNESNTQLKYIGTAPLTSLRVYWLIPVEDLAQNLYAAVCFCLLLPIMYQLYYI